MAGHTLTTQILEQGPKFTIVKVTIKGDSGTATEIAKAKLFDASVYSANIDDKLFNIEYCLNGFSAELFWDATTDDALMSLASSYPYHGCYIEYGGLKNPASSGYTGDILISTLGIASTAYEGHIILRVSWR